VNSNRGQDRLSWPLDLSHAASRFPSGRATSVFTGFQRPQTGHPAYVRPSQSVSY